MINKLLKDYESYPLASEWVKENVPDSNLIYKSGVGNQIKTGLAMTDLVRFELPEPRVASTHNSKSCKLPVLAYKVWHYENGGAICFVRDNFYNIKLSVISEFPISMHYALMHHEMSQEEYNAERQRCIDYDSKGSPRLTIAEVTTDLWMKGWSGNKIIRKDNKIWKAYNVNSCYCEGINRLDLPPEVFEPYEDNKSMFTIELASHAHVGYLLEHIHNNVEHGAYLKLKEN
jgi:hypothetical protein